MPQKQDGIPGAAAKRRRARKDGRKSLPVERAGAAAKTPAPSELYKVRPDPVYPNSSFSSAASLYPAFSTCASANSCEKMMKSRDSS